VHLLHGLDAHFELAFIKHRDLRAGLDAPRLGVPCGVDQPGDAGSDEMLVFVCLQQVERFLVGEGRVIDVLDAVADALLDRSGGAGMRGQHFVPALCLLRRHGHFFFRHRRLFSAHAGDLFPREVELDGIDAVFDELTDGTAHFLRAGHDDPEVETLVRNVRRRRVAKATDGRDLRTPPPDSAARGNALH
jgi:hypothetical protein